MMRTCPIGHETAFPRTCPVCAAIRQPIKSVKQLAEWVMASTAKAREARARTISLSRRKSKGWITGRAQRLSEGVEK